MVLPQTILQAFALITLVLGLIFVYYDIKSRSASNALFLITSIFAVVEFVIFGMFQFSIMLVIPALILVLVGAVSYYTGNIGTGDIPILATVLIFMFNAGVVINNLVFFTIAFMLLFMLMPFILYRKVLSRFEKALAYGSVAITAIVVILNLIAGMVVFLITIGILSYVILGEKDEMYKDAVKYLTKDRLVIGDLIENDLLDQESRVKLGIDKFDGLTNINKEIMGKIGNEMKLPIYSNSIPFTVPLVIGFICVILLFLGV